MRSFTSLFVFKIYFEIWRSRWDLKDTFPAYHCNYQHPIHKLEIQPKTIWRSSLTKCVGIFTETLYYAAIMNGFYLFILKSLSFYFTLTDYSFTGCFWFPDLVSGGRAGQYLWLRSWTDSSGQAALDEAALHHLLQSKKQISSHPPRN